MLHGITICSEESSGPTNIESFNQLTNLPHNFFLNNPTSYNVNLHLEQLTYDATNEYNSYWKKFYGVLLGAGVL